MTESYERQKGWNDDRVKSLDNKKLSETTILPNKKEMASDMAKEMTSDIKRWVKENQTSMPKSFEGKSDADIEHIIAKKIESKISNHNSDSIFKFSDGTINFNIDGIPEYSDGQPLSIDYDPKTKKIKNFYYL